MSAGFLQFAKLCDALTATTKKLEKRALIAEYLRALEVRDAARAALYLAGTPFSETDGRVLNVGGALLSKALATISGANQQAMHAAYRRHGCITIEAFKRSSAFEATMRDREIGN